MKTLVLLYIELLQAERKDSSDQVSFVILNCKKYGSKGIRQWTLNILMKIHNDDQKKNNIFCILKSLYTTCLEPANNNTIKISKVF